MFNTLYLDGPLRKNPPDFFHQMFQKVFVAQMPEQIVIQVLHGVAELIRPQPVGFLEITNHQIEIHRQYLGEKVMGVLG